MTHGLKSVLTRYHNSNTAAISATERLRSAAAERVELGNEETERNDGLFKMDRGGARLGIRRTYWRNDGLRSGLHGQPK